MSDHPIEGLMKTAMESIKEMVDVNTIVGDPVETPDGSVIIPVSRVACGFAAGGGEFEGAAGQQENGGGGGGGQQGSGTAMPFGGGSGAGVSVQPVGFLVVGQGQIRLMPVDGNAVVDRIIDVAPQMVSQLQSMFRREHRHHEHHDEC
ncbi:GerW family sporulation protein [Phosphitispora fastidiosa]|uniref:GerW family sporulation protein n=1 Tax=Phosphitispora fastidiosa TaxID=2837202 RepID=UPI001E2F2C73|nr:GerW family sporulation protein [Phosphitispora fastidiosa]MBU7005311.1 sporulation protein YtfJ [Phosphitispora fastidiosa]